MIYAVIDTNVLVAAAKSHKPDSSASRVAAPCSSAEEKRAYRKKISAEYYEED